MSMVCVDASAIAPAQLTRTRPSLPSISYEAVLDDELPSTRLVIVVSCSVRFYFPQ